MIDQNEYQEFRTAYEMMHPASIPRKEEEVRQYQPWVQWAVLTMFVCAAILSAVHTVPTIYEGIDENAVHPAVRQIAAGLSFVFVELMILLSAYLYIRNKGWAVFVGGFTFIVAAFANVQSALLSFGMDANANLWTMFVSVLVGLLAPVVCLAAGKLYVNIQHSQASAHYRVQKKYEEDMRAWDNEIRHAYEQWKKQNQKRSRATVREQPQKQSENRNEDAPQVVRTYLMENPDDMKLSVRKLAEKISAERSPVSPTTVHKILKEFSTVPESSGNGHH